jgi:hypothetical protein
MTIKTIVSLGGYSLPWQASDCRRDPAQPVFAAQTCPELHQNPPQIGRRGRHGCLKDKDLRDDNRNPRDAPQRHVLPVSHAA